jgi:Ser/Thr protein kinase RdoA (MazF antagonist)
MVETAVVFDLAIAASSQPGPDMPAADALFHFVGGFHAVRPLLPVETALLPLLIATRHAMGMTLASWHRYQQPDNPHFDFVLNEDAIRRRMTAIAEIRSPKVEAAMASHATRAGA